MPITTPLNISPYFDDYDENKDFYRILFRPGVSVQVRELNQLQSIIAKQFERFGDNIFQSGTIVSGCSFNFMNNYPYVKLLDNDTNGVPIDPSLFEGLFVKNANNLTAFVINSTDGFEASTPNLKTIYVNYINSGNSGSDTQFSSSDTLTVFDSNNSIFDVIINNGGLNFSNSDTVIFSPVLVVSMSTGTFSVGQYIIQPSTGANVQILTIDTTTYASQNLVALYVTPRAVDLANSQTNSVFWTLSANNDIVNSGNTATGTIRKVLGTGADAFLETNAVGRIKDISMLSRGNGFVLVPTVTVHSPNNSAGIASLNLVAQNYLTKARVAGTGDATGFGYAFGVSNGVIYQKGYFERVESQVVIVEKYNNTPNALAVGFMTEEQIIDSNIDPTLLDNAIGAPDQNAPGANRLKLIPTLTVLDLDVAKNTQGFLTLVEWNDGNPYKQNQLSQYSAIGDEMAKRTFDSSGDFVLDPFLVTTISTSNSQNEGQYYTVVVDSGSAYISGKRVKTNFNYQVDVPKGLNTQVANSLKVSLNYDSYLRINQTAGIFQFSTGDTISLYDTPAGYVANVAGVIVGTITPHGTAIGTARIRSMVFEGGTQGDPTGIYRLYLFNVAMNQGANFKNVKSVYYNGTYKGIGDVIQVFSPTTQANITQLQSVENDQLVFRSGLESIKNSNNALYIYRTIDQTTAAGNNGILVKSIASTPNEFYPYSGTLSNAQMKDLYVVPVGNNLVGYNNLTGTVAVNTTSPNVTGTSTTFLTDLVAGDYVYMFPNNTSFDIKKVVSVVNNTLFVADSNCAYTNASSNFVRTFPKNLPVPFGSRSGLTANVDANGNILTLNFGFSFTGTTSVNTAIGVNIQRQGVTSTNKTINRKQFVLLNLSNNAANTVGPWCIGVSDVFRLRNVYVGNTTVTPNTGIDITSEFYIDHNQNANYLDLSFLFLKPTSAIILKSTDNLLVDFDYSISTSGYYDTVSYLHTSNAAQIATLDSLPLANLTTAAATWEVPELYTYNDGYFDLLNCFDFRPAAANTTSPSSNAATAPVNPTYSLSFGNTADPANDKKFPLPDSLFQADVEQYLGRTDTVIIGSDNNLVVLRGIAQADPAKRIEQNVPKGAMKLQTIHVAPYPNLVKNPSVTLAQVVATGIFNQRDIYTRIKNHLLTTDVNINNVKFTQPQGYDMAQIGNLERRIQNLEYYNSLSILETNITNKIIPSSIDPSLDRFKFGFFADDFSTTIYSDITDPQYAATIEAVDVANTAANTVTSNSLPQAASNLLAPPGFHWNLKHRRGFVQPTYVDFLAIDQNYATLPAPIVSNTLPTSAQIKVFFYDTIDAIDYTDKSLLNQTQKFQFSSKSGNAVIYFLVWSDPVIDVYQGNTLLIDSSSSQSLTSAEVQVLLSDPYSAGFFTPFAATLPPLVLLKDHIINGAGKISFNHNPSLGTDYTVVTKGAFGGFGLPGEGGHYIFMMQYPIDQTFSAGQFVPPTVDGTSSVYWGIMTYQVGTNAPSGTFDRIILTCTGLKPNTQHFFFLNGIQDTTNVQPFGGNLGDTLVSDNGGKLTVTYFFSNIWFNLVANAKLPVFPGQASGSGSDGTGGGGGSRGGSNIYTENFTPAYALFELEGSNSIAYTEVPLIQPNTLIF